MANTALTPPYHDYNIQKSWLPHSYGGIWLQPSTAIETWGSYGYFYDDETEVPCPRSSQLFQIQDFLLSQLQLLLLFLLPAAPAPAASPAAHSYNHIRAIIATTCHSYSCWQCYCYDCY